MSVYITTDNCADFGSITALAVYATPVMFQTVNKHTQKYSEKYTIGLATG
tara:strand:+ start:81 stop:230 length:150 start_codon:yes stop_codon:yes gene_type:complete